MRPVNDKTDVALAWAMYALMFVLCYFLYLIATCGD